MSVYSKRLYGPDALSAAFTSILTVPAGHTYIIQTLALVTFTPAVGTRVSLGINGTGAAQRIYRQAVTADTTRLELETRFVLEENDVLWALADPQVTLTLYGYDLQT